MRTAVFVIGLVLMTCCRGWGEERYECERVWPGTIRIDGKLEEAAWKVAFEVQLTGSQAGEKPQRATRAKLSWDSRYLYVAFVCDDRDVWSTLGQRDDPVYTEDAVEVSVGPEGEEGPIYRFAVNARGDLFDAKAGDTAFDSRVKLAVEVEGTLNQGDDEDWGWKVEMGIPLRDLVGPGGRLPEGGVEWAINLCRGDWPRGEVAPALTGWPAPGVSLYEAGKFGRVEFRDTFFYGCQKVRRGAIKVDGVMEEEEWEKADPVGRFRITYTGAYAKQGTVAKMLWDEKNLYLGFQCDDVDVWSTMKGHDDDLWNEEVVEAFIAPPLMTNGYFEFEINPLNVVLDIAVINPTEGVAEGMYFNKRYDARGLISAVKVDGTVDKREDLDRGWTVEVAIPFSDLVSDGKPGPAAGDVWRMGLYRCEVGKEKEDSEYSAWSPTRAWFHIPKQFGTVIFSE